MPTPVKQADLVHALEWVSSGGLFENAAYVDRETGEVYWASDGTDMDIDLPQDIEDSNRYIAVPHKSDLDLGRGLVARFVEAQCPELYERVRDFFRHKGAYGRFKGLLDEEGLLQAWFDFEAQQTELALREWVEEHGFEIAAEESAPT